MSSSSADDPMAHCMQTGPELEPLPSNVSVSDCDCNDHRYWELSFCNCTPNLYFDVSIPLVESLPSGIIYALIFLVGTIGNSLVIFVVNRYKRMRNVTNVFLASLSTADLCIIWFCVPIQYIKFLSHTWILGSFICYALHYVQQFSMACSVMTLTTISIERYIAIAYPMKTMWLSSIGRAKKIITALWIAAGICAAPTAFRLEYSKYTNDRTNATHHYCLRQFPITLAYRDRWEKVHALYQFILFLVIPLCTMTFCYAKVSWIVYTSSNDSTLRKSAGGGSGYNSMSVRSIRSNSEQLEPPSTINRQMSRRPSSKAIDGNRKQIVQMLIAIVMLYTACWTPYLVDDLLVGFGLICGTSVQPELKYLRMTFKAMAYCQSCINPIVYAFMSQNFRNSFVTAWRSWWQQRSTERSRAGSQSSMTLLSQRVASPGPGNRRISREAEHVLNNTRKTSENNKTSSLKTEIPQKKSVGWRPTVKSSSDHCLKRHESLRRAVLSQNVDMPPLLSDESSAANSVVHDTAV